MTVTSVLIDALCINGSDDSSMVICFDKEDNCDIEFNDCNRIRLSTLKQIVKQAEEFVKYRNDHKK